MKNVFESPEHAPRTAEIGERIQEAHADVVELESALRVLHERMMNASLILNELRSGRLIVKSRLKDSGAARERLDEVLSAALKDYNEQYDLLAEGYTSALEQYGHAAKERENLN